MCSARNGGLIWDSTFSSRIVLVALRITKAGANQQRRGHAGRAFAKPSTAAIIAAGLATPFPAMS